MILAHRWDGSWLGKFFRAFAIIKIAPKISQNEIPWFFNYFRTHEKEILDVPVFIVDELSGTLRTNQTYGEFADGYFVVVVKATNAPQQKDFTKVKVAIKFKMLIFFKSENVCRLFHFVIVILL